MSQLYEVTTKLRQRKLQLNQEVDKAASDSEDEEKHGLKRMLLADMIKILRMKQVYYALQLKQFAIEELNIVFDDLWVKYEDPIKKRALTGLKMHVLKRRQKRDRQWFFRQQLIRLKKYQIMQAWARVRFERIDFESRLRDFFIQQEFRLKFSAFKGLFLTVKESQIAKERQTIVEQFIAYRLKKLVIRWQQGSQELHRLRKAAQARYNNLPYAIHLDREDFEEKMEETADFINNQEVFRARLRAKELK